MSTPTVPIIGVAGVPHVAQALRDIGFTVVTGHSFRDAAIAIASQLKQSKIHVVVETLAEPGFAPWTKATHAKSLGVTLLQTNPEVDVTALTGVKLLPLPATVGDLLVALGYQAALHPAAQTSIVPGQALPQDVPEALPEPEPQHQSPVEPATLPDPAVPTVSSDPFAFLNEAVPAQASDLPDPVVTDPFASPATAQEPAPVPASQLVSADPFAFLNDHPVDAVPSTTAPGEPVPLPAPPIARELPAPVDFAPAVPMPAPQSSYDQQQPLPWETAPAPNVPAPMPWESQAQPAAPTAPAAEPVHRAPAFQPAPTQSDDFFTAPHGGNHRAQVLYSTAGKGGVGKTTFALMYAQTAGQLGLRVLLIDANRDQPDLGSSLRVEHAGLGTIINAVHGSPASAIVSKEEINGARPNSTQDIEFDIVFAPPRDMSGPGYASAGVYARVLDYAKSKYDLVVVDTQIVEANKSDLHLDFMIPELRSGAWSAGIASYDYTAVHNAFAVFEELASLGVTAEHTLIIAAKWPQNEGEAEKFNNRFGHFGTFMGFVANDPAINPQKSIGNILIGSPAVEPVVRAVLYRVTGRAEFAPAPVVKRPRRRLFGGRR